MQAQTTSAGTYLPADGRDAAEPQRSGVSWGAIFAGAAAAAALSLILLLLGSGLGLSAVSPWAYGATAIATPAIIWVAFTQLAASAVGGYMAGRLRVKWVAVHTDEVYFRDTAHGLLAWAVATLLTATLLTGTIRAALSGAIDAGAPVAAAVAAAGTGAAAGAAKDGADNNANPLNYFTDVLLRSDKGMADASAADARAETLRIFATSVHNGSLAADDRAYLARVVAARTGLPQADAEKRVDDVYNRATTTITNAKNAAKEAADKARKAAAHTALWMVVGLMLGAFVASMAATFGGKLRDDMPVHRSPLTR